MLAFTSVNTDALEPPLRLNLAIAALLCGFAVAWPWVPWVTPVGALSAAMLPWLARRVTGTRPYAPFSSVYAACAVFLVPPYTFESLVSTRFVAFFSTLVLAYLIGAAYDGIEGQSSWAWVAPLLCLIAFPSVLGLTGGLGLALCGRLEPRLSVRLHRPGWSLLGASGLVALAALLAVTLPAPQGWRSDWGAGSKGSLVASGRPAPNPENASDAAPSARPRAAPRQNPENGDWLYASVNLLLLAAVVGLSVLFFKARAQRSRGGSRAQLWDLMPLVAVFILMLILILWSGRAPSGGGATTTQIASGAGGVSANGNSAQVPASPPQTPPRRSQSLSLWLLALALLALGYTLWRLRARSYAFHTEPEAAPESLPDSAHPPSDEVRRCYQRFLELSRDAGWPRGRSETPLEFAARLGSAAPSAALATQQLTEVYEPVRYGGRIGSAEAKTARTALETLKTVLTGSAQRSQA